MRWYPMRVTAARRCPLGKPPRGRRTDTATRRHKDVSDRTCVTRAGRQTHTRAHTQVILRAYTGAQRRTLTRTHKVVSEYGTRVAGTCAPAGAHPHADACRFPASPEQKCGTRHEFACHPCAGAMLIFSVSFQFSICTAEASTGASGAADRICTACGRAHSSHGS